jgi:carbon monoxide dehydrogenase subunit G
VKFHQEFRLLGSVPDLWRFFEQPLRVAACIPGVEKVDLIDDSHLLVRITQKVGPLGATFESKVEITERVREQRLQFSAMGKAVRGSIGNFRATNTVSLHADGGHTRVVVEGEVVLGGALGSVAQRIVLKQAEKVVAEFAEKLERVLSGTEDALLPGAASRAAETRTAPASRVSEVGEPTLVDAVRRAVLWARIAAALAATALLVGLLTLWRVSARG